MYVSLKLTSLVRLIVGTVAATALTTVLLVSDLPRVDQPNQPMPAATLNMTTERGQSARGADSIMPGAAKPDRELVTDIWGRRQYHSRLDQAPSSGP